MHRRSPAKGFTLIEMLLVILILGSLVAMLVPQLTESTTPALRSEVQSDIVRLQSAMTDVYQETGSYAASTTGYITSSAAPLNFRTSNPSISYTITTTVNGQGATLAMKFATSSGTTTQCTLNLGTNANPGVVTCT